MLPAKKISTHQSPTVRSFVRGKLRPIISDLVKEKGYTLLQVSRVVAVELGVSERTIHRYLSVPEPIEK